jgi:hypothetical protein
MGEPWAKSSGFYLPAQYGATEGGDGTAQGSYLDTYDETGISYAATNYVQGSQNPRWRDQIRQGQNATTGMYGLKYTGSAVWFVCVGNCSWYLTDNPTVYQNQYFEAGGYPSYTLTPDDDEVPPDIITRVTNTAIAKFINSVNGAESSNNLTGRSIKHLSHDLHSVSNPMAGIRGQITKYLSSLTKGKTGRISKKLLLRNVRSAYLEFTFGLEPFTDDITAILSDISHRRFPTVPVSGSGHGLYDGSYSPITLTPSTGITDGHPYMPCTFTRTYSVRIKGAVHTHASGGTIGLIQSQRLLPSDWAPTLFSILPYAWMVNYFSNIGNIIDALSFVFSNLAWGCMTTRYEQKIQYGDVRIDPWTPFGPFDGLTYSSNNTSSHGGGTTITRVEVNRSVLVAADLLPQLQFQIPTKPKQWLNMMAAFLPRIQGVVSILTGK